MASVFKRSNRPGSNWYIRYRDENGRQIQVKAGPEKREAQRLANDLEVQAIRRKRGLVDDRADRLAAEGKRPIGEHVAAFKTHLTEKGGTQNHVEFTTGAVEHAILDCGWSCLNEICETDLDGHRARLRTAGRSAATINRRTRAIKQFTRRLWVWGRIPTDPLVGVAMLNEQTDRRRVRGAFSDDELVKLFKAAEREHVKVPPRFATDGRTLNNARKFTIPHRDLLYRLAVNTALRLSEIRSLRVADFHLDGDQPTVRLAARASKRRTVDVLPLRRDLVDPLRPFLARQHPQARPWSGLPNTMAGVVRADCARAGIPVETEAGERLDFHALRHTAITRWARAGVPFRTVQELARHSTPVLTAMVYSHLGIRDTAGAVESLPAIGEAAEQQARA